MASKLNFLAFQAGLHSLLPYSVDMTVAQVTCQGMLVEQLEHWMYLRMVDTTLACTECKM